MGICYILTINSCVPSRFLGTVLDTGMPAVKRNLKFLGIFEDTWVTVWL